MAKYEFIHKSEYKKYSKELWDSIRWLQNQFRPFLKFDPKLIGSTRYRLVTKLGNESEFDFDISLIITKNKNKWDENKIRNTIFSKLQKYAGNHKNFHNNIDNDSKSMKLKYMINKNKDSNPIFKIEIAIFMKIENEWNILKFNKKENLCIWNNENVEDIYELQQEFTKIKKMGKWQEFKDLFLEKKNHHHHHTQNNEKPTTLSIYKETVKELYDKYNK